MLNSTIVQIPIARPYEAAYAVLREPSNFQLWSPVLNSRFEPRGNGGLDWLVDLPQGPAVIRFSPSNEFGVLDYTVMAEGATSGRTTALRLVRNAEGCELVAQFFQQDGQSDEAFASYVEWAKNDLMALKSVVEAG